MKKWLILGIAFILAGILIVAYYDCSVRPGKDAKIMLTEGKMIFERGNSESINRAIDIFTKVIARYPGSEPAFESYYLIAQSYEKLNLNRLAYLKYIYILKNNKDLSDTTKREINARIARLKILKRYDEEGIHYLLTALNYSEDTDFRSRVYTELGHTFLKKGEYSRSLRMFDLAMRENGQNEEAVIGKARAYKRLGRDDLAYNLYDHFLKYFGSFSYYTDDVLKSYDNQLFSSGIANYRRGAYYNAISFFRRYITKFPGNSKVEESLYWIGECYFSMKKYNSAVKYFSQVRSNGFHNRDQDAIIKTGYSYFLAKNYELASREFQNYLDDYPNGRYRARASEWKRMSDKEIMYRLNNDSYENSIQNPKKEKESEKSSMNYDENDDSRTIQTRYSKNTSEENNETVRKTELSEYDNVAEL